MASNRHLGRIIALQSLYELDMRVTAEDDSIDIEEIIERNLHRFKSEVDDKEFVVNLIKGVHQKSSELDQKLQPVAPDWPLQQIARVDHIILRIGAYELLFTPDVPAKVVINEAVELAKSFGAENASKFVNGVLGTVYRQREGITSEQSPESEQPQEEPQSS